MAGPRGQRGEPAEGGEVDGEELPSREPHVGAEDGHRDPRERRVAEHREGQGPGDLALAPRELHRGEGHEGEDGRRDAPSGRVGRAGPAGRAARADQVVHGGPRVDERPEVSDEGGQIREPDPPENPDRDRRDVLEGLLHAEEPGRDQQDEHGEGAEAERPPRCRAGQHPAGNPAAELDGPTDRRGAPAHEPRHQEERQANGEARARQVEPERDGQLVALPQTVRGRGQGSAEQDARRAGDRRGAGLSRAALRAHFVIPSGAWEAGRARPASASRPISAPRGGSTSAGARCCSGCGRSP
jgi:hypothetical protein